MISSNSIEANISRGKIINNSNNQATSFSFLNTSNTSSSSSSRLVNSSSAFNQNDSFSHLNQYNSNNNLNNLNFNHQQYHHNHQQPMHSSGNLASMTEADRKRAHHNALERKRRDHIKDSFHTLRDAIPNIKGEKVKFVY